MQIPSVVLLGRNERIQQLSKFVQVGSVVWSDSMDTNGRDLVVTETIPVLGTVRIAADTVAASSEVEFASDGVTSTISSGIYTLLPLRSPAPTTITVGYGSIG